MSMPDLVSPSAPAGEQKAPGRTPMRMAGVVGAAVGFLVVGLGFGFGLGFGLLVTVRRGVGFAVARDRLGLALGETDEGLIGRAEAAPLDRLIEGSTMSGRLPTAVVLDVPGSSGPAKTPTIAVPPQHKATRPTTDRMTALIRRFFPSAGTAGCWAVGCHQGGAGSGVVTDPLWPS